MVFCSDNLSGPLKKYHFNFLILLIRNFRALPIVKDSDLYSWGLPNAWNISFNFYYILIALLPGYIVIFPQLYSHMFRQVILKLTRKLNIFFSSNFTSWQLIQINNTNYCQMCLLGLRIYIWTKRQKFVVFCPFLIIRCRYMDKRTPLKMYEWIFLMIIFTNK